MGVLAPLYLAGLAALSLPLIFHLVRRTPRGKLPFSSLMFLSPSPPRLTRRSRLDQILLLLLRAAVLALLAFAFARPFLREAATLALDGVASRRVAILIDTSASMRRGDLWQQAVQRAKQEVAELSPHDDVALYACDDRLRALVEFEREGAAAATAKPQIVQQLDALRPGWGGTDLGTALVTLASEFDVTADVGQLGGDPLIVVISDMQQGARTDALQGYEWPERVRVVLHPLSPARPTNAFAHILTSDDEAQPEQLRVRVASSANSTGDQFFVGWANETKASSDEIAVYVPPGQSRVVRLPRPATSLFADQIVLRGDDHTFDNVHYVVPPQVQDVRLAYLGPEAPDDPQGMQFYLRAALADDPLRNVAVQSRDQWSRSHDDIAMRPHLIIATGPLSADEVSALQQYVERGGTLLLVPRDRQAAVSLVPLLDDVELRDEPPLAEGKYLLLGEIDFQHPLFAPFANPRYSDFTKVHFWRHQPVTLKENAASKVLARFDNGDPALIESADSRVLLLTSGWNPDDSQLALSSKFVPLVQALLDYVRGPAELAGSLTVGEPLPLPAERTATTLVQTPDGQQVSVSRDATTFEGTDRPGIYRVQSGDMETQFAVNVAAAESNTAPLELEQLEQWGVKLGTSLTRAERIDRVRQQRDTELESRQKLWRWLIVGALGILIVETWWAARAARQTTAATEDGAAALA
jgi:hypothetical protein